MIKYPLLFIAALFISFAATGQKKSLLAQRISEKVTIDGKLDDAVWKSAQTATDFIMFQPDNGKPISPEKKTDVKILFDDDAIYVGAIMYDNEPDKILKEMTQRDNFGSADHFGIFINGFNDSQQEFQFFLSAAGVQMDCVATNSNGEDYSWDAIWDGNVTITDFGWVAEMKIPYAALRFSGEGKQTWGLNLYRELRRDRQQYTWNYIDAKIGPVLSQSGLLEGIENITPPTRLFFIPYGSYYYNKSAEISEHTVKGGLDIKYGINESFTLDAILIPDFGQTKFDNIELNLGPFEQTFNENRPFFTEGTDLFNKGNLLYSRRIGGSPSFNSNDPNISLVVPPTVNLLNALKVSGRTKDGLGIGILNAVTERTFGVVTNITTGESQEIVVEPLTNFNVVVFDQRFGKNSSISFVNTNVTRDGNFRDANVSAAVFELTDEKQNYNVSGSVKYSYVNEYQDQENRSGVSSSLNLSETAGKYRFSFGGNYVSKDYDINDLGVNFQTHYHSVYGNSSYRILNPNKTFNTFSLSSNLYSECDNATGKIQQGNIGLYLNSTTLKNDYINIGFNVRPFQTFDFYEPRVEGRYVYIPRSINSSIYISTNYNRKFAVDWNPYFTMTDEKKRESWGMYIEPRFRFSDRFTTSLGVNFNHQSNNAGQIPNIAGDDQIYFAKRNRNTYTLSSYAKYSINKDMTINLSARYYWSYVDNREFFTLDDDGGLTPAIYTGNQDQNYNSWNLDLSYSWWFAPGSQISVLYRDNSATFDRVINTNITNNFSNLFQDNLSHVFSVSIRYFIDYNQAKNWF